MQFGVAEFPNFPTSALIKQKKKMLGDLLQISHIPFNLIFSQTKNSM